jgi:hypothetical protein
MNLLPELLAADQPTAIVLRKSLAETKHAGGEHEHAKPSGR